MECLLPFIAILSSIGIMLSVFTLLDFLSGEPFEEWIIYDLFGRWTKK